MFTAYGVVTVLAAGANICAATNDFTRAEWLHASMTKLGVPDSWLFSLGAQGGGRPWTFGGYRRASDQDRGLSWPRPILFGCHCHRHACQLVRHIPYPAAWLALAVASLVLRLASL